VADDCLDTEISALYCSDCTAPVVLAHVEGEGYQLRCCCGNRAIDVTDETAESALLEPLTGAWSSLDE